MPRIEKFFANSKVTDWTSDSVGASAGGGFCAVGGTQATYPNPAGGIYVSHAIEATGNFQVTAGSADVDILIVGGGSSGSFGPLNKCNNGGGAGGGFREVTGQPVSSTGGPGGNGIYPIVIGAGGAYSPAFPHTAAQMGQGNATTALGLSASGGGARSNIANVYPFPSPQFPYYTLSAGQPGGSGGGGMGAGDVPGWPAPQPAYLPFNAAGTGNAGGYPTPEGNSGGAGLQSPGTGGGAGGGSGGAGGAGSAGICPSPTYNVGGPAGPGAPNVYRHGPGTPVGYAGGSMGTGNPGVNGNAGSPTGGAGTTGSSGEANTGGGGGDKNPSPTPTGGSGIVVIRYAVPA